MLVYTRYGYVLLSRVFYLTVLWTFIKELNLAQQYIWKCKPLLCLQESLMFITSETEIHF